MWRHTRKGDKYVTAIIDLTGIRDGTGPARLLDMVGGPLQAGVQALAGRPAIGLAERDEVVVMDGFTGSKPPLPNTLQMRCHQGPFHVVRSARLGAP